MQSFFGTVFAKDDRKYAEYTIQVRYKNNEIDYERAINECKMIATFFKDVLLCNITVFGREKLVGDEPIDPCPGNDAGKLLMVYNFDEKNNPEVFYIVERANGPYDCGFTQFAEIAKFFTGESNMRWKGNDRGGGLPYDGAAYISPDRRQSIIIRSHKYRTYIMPNEERVLHDKLVSQIEHFGGGRRGRRAHNVYASWRNTSRKTRDGRVLWRHSVTGEERVRRMVTDKRTGVRKARYVKV